ncbi:MAG: hypothetical protein V1875_00925 [Candidatus Altiarchaeota archaeon]
MEVIDRWNSKEYGLHLYEIISGSIVVSIITHAFADYFPFNFILGLGLPALYFRPRKKEKTEEKSKFFICGRTLAVVQFFCICLFFYIPDMVQYWNSIPVYDPAPRFDWALNGSGSYYLPGSMAEDQPNVFEYYEKNGSFKAGLSNFFYNSTGLLGYNPDGNLAQSMHINVVYLGYSPDNMSWRNIPDSYLSFKNISISKENRECQNPRILSPTGDEIIPPKELIMVEAMCPPYVSNESYRIIIKADMIAEPKTNRSDKTTHQMIFKVEGTKLEDSIETTFKRWVVSTLGSK